MDAKHSVIQGLHCNAYFTPCFSIGTDLTNYVESDLGYISRFNFDNMTLMSQEPCQHNNKCDCRETNGYNIPQ